MWSDTLFWAEVAVAAALTTVDGGGCYVFTQSGKLSRPHTGGADVGIVPLKIWENQIFKLSLFLFVKQSSNKRTRRSLRLAYELMFQAAGHQEWWPAETAFEVCVGAILTQNTSWTNVERALDMLREHQALDLAVLNSLATDELAELIRSAGYHNVKAKRLKAFSAFIFDEYGGKLELFFQEDAARARDALLAVNGIGPETADCILLYACGIPSFVVDTYTKRIFSRHSWIRDEASYIEVKRLCEESLSEPCVFNRSRLDYWQDYHAQIVRIGKDFCRPKNPRCELCPLRGLLPSALVEG